MVPTGGPSFSFDSSTTYLNNLVNPYSLTIVSTIIHQAGGGSTSFDAVINVPEPSMIALMSLGLVGLGFAGRRKQSK